MKLTSISKTIYLSEFPTDVLITELYNRISDHMEDPEPQHDPALEGITNNEKLKILSSLAGLK